MIIFVDSSAWYAIADKSDRNTKGAATFFQKNLETAQWVTSNAVLFESWNLIRNKLGWQAAYRFLENFRKSDIKILWIEREDLEIAWRILNDYADQELSFVDATSFAMMERQGIIHTFTFDRDFLLYRFGLKKQHAFTCYP